MAENKRTAAPAKEPGGPRGRRQFQKPKDAKKSLMRLMKYLNKHKLILCFVAVLIVISALTTIATSYYLKPIINDYILTGDFNGLAFMLLKLGGIYLVGVVASYVYSRTMVSISQKVVAAMRDDLFDKLKSLPLKFFDSHTHGEVMSRFINDIDTISEAITGSFTNIISAAITFSGSIIMMIILSPWLFVITAVFLFIMIVASKKIGFKSKQYFKAQQKSIGELNGFIEEMIEGQKVVKVFCHEDKALEEFQVKNNALKKASTNANTYAGMMMPVMGNLSHINYAFTACAGGILAITTATFDIGSLIAFLQYIRQVSHPVTMVSQQFNIILAALAGAERVFEVMDQPPEVDEGKTVLVRLDKNGNITDEKTGLWAWKKPDGSIVELKGDVKFDDVVFGYNEDKTVLKHISLYAKPGQKIAFVGSTGAGKTTITNLINRFYDVNSGQIVYDGIPVNEIDKASLRHSLAVVLQDTHLFTGTIADNIRYGNPDATDEQVVAAAKLANADSFISHLPDGYETFLSGDGGNLSQGQRQLLSIARAAVADPPVLILDEATSSIDTRTEKLIEKGMDSLMKGRTVFVIAHRLSTIRNAAAIMVLEHGEIIERGNHDELLAQKGRYYQLYTGNAELD